MPILSSEPRLLFVGSKPLGLSCLKTLHEVAPRSLGGVVTFDDNLDVRTALDDFKQYCRSSEVPLTIAVNKAHSERVIQEFRPDFVFVCGWYWLLGKQTLDSATRAVFGIHASLLPKYRGISPLVWAIINGDARAGLTLFSITEGMDEGDIWVQEEVAILENDTVGEVLQRVDECAVTILREFFPKILANEIVPRPQDNSQATYCAARLPGDGEIDWNQSARCVHNFVRAQSDPYPGAFTWADGRKVTIWRTRLLPYLYYGTPGQVARLCKEGVIVTCGDGRAVMIVLASTDTAREAAPAIIRSTKVRFHRSIGECSGAIRHKPA